MMTYSAQYHHAREAGYDPATEFGQLLKAMAMFEVTDPRDVIFGSLGLASNKDWLGLQPDYSKTLREVLLETARALVTMESTGWNSYAERENRNNGIPSWVPVWSSNARRFHAHSYNACGDATRNEETNDEDEDDAAWEDMQGNRTPTPSEEKAQETITLDGYLVDVITDLLPTCARELFRTSKRVGTRVGTEDGEESTISIIERAENIMKQKRSPFAQKSDALARTLVVDILSTPFDQRIDPDVDANQLLLKIKQAQIQSVVEDFFLLESFDDWTTLETVH
ncbi:hypothetical protein BT63DRAFT_27284 [Microthyrium microscopicum]|uniref:Uncharacterized protein n=1 Tax=Microthyrium microscopicum TaxID=703497 RepID=A0A6A6US23_9PEZI|nr:hypothetical protein BT63DRAFT_27284 [Microthyrium microscopicum]